MSVSLAITSIAIPWPITLACACVFSYLVGRITFGPKEPEEKTDVAVLPVGNSRTDFQQMAENIDRNLAVHRASVEHFKDILLEMEHTDDSVTRAGLGRDARATLDKTINLASKLAETNEDFRRKIGSPPAVVLSDPLTGLQNHDALEASLVQMFAMQARYELPFSVVTLGTHRSHDDGHNCRGPLCDGEIKRMADLLNESARDTDLVARDNSETFVVLLPNTTADAAISFADRLRQEIAAELERDFCAGVALAAATDGPHSLLTRTLRALEHAREDSEPGVAFHDGMKAVPADEDHADPVLVEA